MRTIFSILLGSVLAVSCQTGAPDSTAKASITGSAESKVLIHPEWSKNANIYEVNVRQHTPEGTFAALTADLNRLDSMGVDILWLMPIHPIGKENRKGSLGSYYSVKDYKGVNPEYGTIEDFKAFVRAAHSKGMKVILDWVANHTAFDAVWVSEHKDWYTLDSTGRPVPPVADWSDVADLNYDNKEMRAAMIDAMKFWIKECDIDGYRCDVAMMVPTDFWNDARASLDSIKPVFMLAEAEMKEHHLKAFDMSYTWEFLHIMNEVASGKKNLSAIDTYLAQQDTAFPKNAYRMYFTTNHDENTWNGTGNERYGKARQVYDVLALTIGGMPLIYSGQEGGEQYEDGKPHRYRFFDKDTIRWNGYKYQDFYTRILAAHKKNPALWNGEHGGKAKRIKTSNDDIIYAFTRKVDNNEVIVLLNFSDKPQKIDFIDTLPEGNFMSIFNNETLSIYSKGNVKLQGYGYQVFVK
ncbi:MAG: alpha-amylase family glycosyl hydrolase [Flavobacteriales bacterium]|jgi:glycosidase